MAVFPPQRKYGTVRPGLPLALNPPWKHAPEGSALIEREAELVVPLQAEVVAREQAVQERLFDLESRSLLIQWLAWEYPILAMDPCVDPNRRILHSSLAR